MLAVELLQRTVREGHCLLTVLLFTKVLFILLLQCCCYRGGV